jgi:hypothetical protein
MDDACFSKPLPLEQLKFKVAELGIEEIGCFRCSATQIRPGDGNSMKLEESLREKRFVVTSEIQPPIEVDVQELMQGVNRIRGRVDALTVPDLKIEGLVTDTMGTCRILKAQQFEPILQTTCREKSRVDIQEQLLKASELGIENILTFTEDYRITGDSLQEIMYFHVDSGKLFRGR